MKVRKYSKEQLKKAVENASSYRQVLSQLSVAPYNGNYEAVKSAIEQFQLDTSHFTESNWQKGRSLQLKYMLSDYLQSKSAANQPAPNQPAPNQPGANQPGQENSPANAENANSNADSKAAPQAQTEQHPPEKTVQLPAAKTPTKPPPPVAPTPIAPAKLPIKRRLNPNALKNKLLEKAILKPMCYKCQNKTWLNNPIPLQLDFINGNPKDRRLENLRLLCPNCMALRR